MSTDWVPHRESELVNFSTSFSNAINADPTAYGLDITTAGDFATLNTAWVTAYAAATNGNTRGTLTIQEKNDAKDAMLPELRRLGMYIQKRPETTNAQRVTLGLTIPDPEPSPVPVPSTAPSLTIKSVFGQQITYILRDPDSDSRGKPEGVAGATLFAYLGDTPPGNMSQWNMVGTVTRTNAKLILPAETYPPGSKIWLAAAWFNTKGQPGPTGAWQSCYLAGGGTQQQAA